MAPTDAARPAPHRKRLRSLIVDGHAIAYQDVGTGPAVILAHCSSASHRIWAPLVDALQGRYRVLAPDLLGYGQSDRWPANVSLDRWSDLNTLLALADLSDGPVHLVGHSYGGAVALEAARVLGPRVRSLTLIEPVAIHLLRLTGRTREWREVTDVGERMIAALRLRRDHEAAAVYMKYWVGRLAWWMMSRKVRMRVVETAGKVGAEFDAASRLSRTVGDYGSILVPTRLVAGERTRAPARAIVDELLNILPRAHLRVIPRAGHMSPVTHAAAITALVSEQVGGSDVVRDVGQSAPISVRQAASSRAELSRAVAAAIGRRGRGPARIESLP